MIRHLGIAAYTSLLVTSAAHAAVSFSECSSFSSILNRDYPQRVDKITSVRGTACIAGPKRPALVYMMKIDVQKIQMPADWPSSAIPTQLSFWCTSPEQLKLLKMVDIKYQYSDLNGVYAGETHLTIENCPR
jgi:hypothetical protein